MLNGPTDLPVFKLDILNFNFTKSYTKKKLLHTGLFRYTIGLLDTLGI